MWKSQELKPFFAHKSKSVGAIATQRKWSWLGLTFTHVMIIGALLSLILVGVISGVIGHSMGWEARSDAVPPPSLPAPLPFQSSEDGWYAVEAGFCTIQNYDDSSIEMTYTQDTQLLFTDPPDVRVVSPRSLLALDRQSGRPLVVSFNMMFVGTVNNHTHDSTGTSTLRLDGEALVPWRKTECECIKIDATSDMVAAAQVSFPHINLTDMLDGYNTEPSCKAWDAETPACTTEPPHDYCNSQWCYVNSTCDFAAFPSTFSTEALPLYYSYDTCADVQPHNSWMSAHARRCFLFDSTPETNGMGQGTCSINDGHITVDDPDGMEFYSLDGGHVRVQDLTDNELQGFVGRRAAVHNHASDYSILTITIISKNHLEGEALYSTRADMWNTPWGPAEQHVEACNVAIDKLACKNECNTGSWYNDQKEFVEGDVVRQCESKSYQWGDWWNDVTTHCWTGWRYSLSFLHCEGYWYQTFIPENGQAMPFASDGTLSDWNAWICTGCNGDSGTPGCSYGRWANPNGYPVQLITSPSPPPSPPPPRPPPPPSPPPSPPRPPNPPPPTPSPPPPSPSPPPLPPPGGEEGYETCIQWMELPNQIYTNHTALCAYWCCPCFHGNTFVNNNDVPSHCGALWNATWTTTTPYFYYLCQVNFNSNVLTDQGQVCNTTYRTTLWS